MESALYWPNGIRGIDGENVTIYALCIMCYVNGPVVWSSLPVVLLTRTPDILLATQNVLIEDCLLIAHLLPRQKFALYKNYYYSYYFFTLGIYSRGRFKN